MSVQQLTECCHTGAYQAALGRWVLECFGDELAVNTLIRADRFLEEALELCQTEDGFCRERAHALVDYVFDRPVGNREQEVGGVMNTLAAYCNPHRIDMGIQANRELTRVWGKIDVIRAKQATKEARTAHLSPLPTAEAADAYREYTGPVETTVSPKGVPMRRMTVTRELARHAIGEWLFFAGKTYRQGAGIEMGEPNAWMYVIDEDMTAQPIITVNRWPEYVAPPSRAGTRSRFREIPLWEVTEGDMK